MNSTYLINHDEAFILSIPDGCGGERLIDAAVGEQIDMPGLFEPEGYERYLLVRNPYARIVSLFEAGLDGDSLSRRERDLKFNKWFIQYAARLYRPGPGRGVPGTYQNSLFRHWVDLFGILDKYQAEDEQFIRAEYDLEQFGVENVEVSGWQDYYFRLKEEKDNLVIPLQWGAFSDGRLGVSVLPRVERHNKIWCDVDCRLLHNAGFAEEYPHSSQW